MNVRDEIEKYSDEKDKKVLLWLLERYHYASEWSFVAECSFKSYGKANWESVRVWKPTEEGKAIYDKNCENINTEQKEKWKKEYEALGMDATMEDADRLIKKLSDDDLKEFIKAHVIVYYYTGLDMRQYYMMTEAQAVLVRRQGKKRRVYGM